MHSSRKMRKLGSRDENGVSKQSILSAMDRFVNAVDNMNETVMVPSRLIDMAVSDEPSVDRADLFAFFNMLNSVKTELIWGPGSSNRLLKQEPCSLSSITSTSSLGSLSPMNGPPSINPMMMSSLTSSTPSLGPISTISSISNNNQRASTGNRRLSIVSSMSLSDSEADTESLSESDSGLEYDERSSTAAHNFRHHLNGLYQALQQLTSTADVLTGRYQDEVGGAS